METIIQHRNYSGTIKILSSEIETLKNGFFYSVFQAGNRKYLFDNKGNKTFLVKKKVKWIETDNVVMIIKITSSLLDTIITDKVYRVFNDIENDERYIFDEQNRKVLFDRTIFNYEIINETDYLKD